MIELFCIKHMAKFIWVILIFFVTEGAIWCMSMPREFRSEIIPRINENIKDYNKLNEKIEKLISFEHRRIDMLMELKRQELLRESSIYNLEERFY